MATGAWAGGRVGRRIAASGPRVFLEHALPVALQAWRAEHLSAMCRAAGRADPQAAEATSCTGECPSGIWGLISAVPAASCRLSRLFAVFSIQVFMLRNLHPHER